MRGAFDLIRRSGSAPDKIAWERLVCHRVISCSVKHSTSLCVFMYFYSRLESRPMDSQPEPKKTYLTADGARRLREELDNLKSVKRLELAERLRFAIKQGDLSENADYTAAKEEQGFLEGRILDLERTLRDIVILDESANVPGIVRLGSMVTVVEQGFSDRETFHLVGIAEADPTQG